MSHPTVKELLSGEVYYAIISKHTRPDENDKTVFEIRATSDLIDFIEVSRILEARCISGAAGVFKFEIEYPDKELANLFFRNKSDADVALENCTEGVVVPVTLGKVKLTKEYLDYYGRVSQVFYDYDPVAWISVRVKELEDVTT